jgi:ABC-type glycerol-3-phosphate transport system substrate-binding protein
LSKILLRSNKLEITIRVKRRQIIALLTSLFLVVILVLSACAQQAAPTTPTTPTTPVAPTTPTTPTTPAAPQVVEKVVTPTYKVLNPQGNRIPVECKPLAPRLATLDGKTILFYHSEANPVILPVLLKRMQKDYPKTTFKVLYTEQWGLATPGDEAKGIDAEIRGVSW